MTDRHAILLAITIVIVGAVVLDLWRWLVALCLVATLGLVLRALAGRSGWGREHHAASPRAPAPAAWRAPQGVLDPDAPAATPAPPATAPVVVQVGPVTILVPQSAEASTPAVSLRPPAPSPAPGLPAPTGAAWAAEPAGLPEPKEVR